MNDENNIVISTKRFEELIQAQTALNIIKHIIAGVSYSYADEIKALFDAIDPGWRTEKEGTDAE